MKRLWPTRYQWNRWTLPSKLTAISVLVGLIGIFFTLVSPWLTSPKEPIGANPRSTQETTLKPEASVSTNSSTETSRTDENSESEVVQEEGQHTFSENIRICEPASANEMTIFIIPFYHATNILGTEVHLNLKESLEERFASMPIDNESGSEMSLRVILGQPTINISELLINEIRNECSADIIISGRITAGKVEVIFRGFDIAHLQTISLATKSNENFSSENEVSAIVDTHLDYQLLGPFKIKSTSQTPTTAKIDPYSYNEFLTEGLPSQVSLLTFFALSHLLLSSDQIESAMTFIDDSIIKFPNLTETGPIIELVNVYAYVLLGQLVESTNSSYTLKSCKSAYECYSHAAAIEITEPDARSYLIRGMAQSNIQKHRRAIADYSEAIQLQNDLFTAYLLRAMEYIMIWQFDAAISSLRGLFELAPDLDSILEQDEEPSAEDKFDFSMQGQRLTRTHLLTNPHWIPVYLASNKTKHYLQDLIDLAEETNFEQIIPGLIAVRGYLHVFQNKISLAIEDLSEVLEFEEHENLLFLRANLLWLDGRINESIEDFQRADQIHPERWLEYFDDFDRFWLENDAIHFWHQSSNKEIIEDLNAAIEIDPEFLPFVFIRAVLHWKLKNRDEAGKDIEEFLSHFPNNMSANFIQGQLYMMGNEYHKAIESFAKVLTNDSDQYWVLNDRANAYARLGFYDLALKDYDSILAHSAFLITAYENQVDEDHDEFDTLWEEMGVILVPPTPEIYSIHKETNDFLLNAYIGRAHVYEAVGEFELALEDLRAVSLLQPQKNSIYKKMGQIYWNLDNREEALFSYLKFVKYDDRLRYIVTNAIFVAIVAYLLASQNQ